MTADQHSLLSAVWTSAPLVVQDNTALQATPLMLDCFVSVFSNILQPEMEVPDFSRLPLTRPGPPFNAWGLYGPDDELGRVNLITAAAVRRGAESVKLGLVVNLKRAIDTGRNDTVLIICLPLDQKIHSHDRKGLQQTILIRSPFIDDELTFNTQCSTQWDGLRHYPYVDYPGPGEMRFYNGQTLASALSTSHKLNGVHNFSRHPITSRAHLLDIPRYLQRYGLPPLSHVAPATPISLSMLRGCTLDEKCEFLPGDVLLVRTGHLEWRLTLDPGEEAAIVQKVGIEQTEEVLRWHWDQGFAAVAADNVGYEHTPSRGISLHQVFIAGWGMPIGEFFDLRRLSKECDRLGRWTFFLTSMPLNVTGGIASPPNAQAIL